MNLCTLAQYKAYMAVSDGNQDAQIGALIPNASAMCLNYMQRGIQRSTYTGAKFNGKGTQRLMLPDYPIISVSLVQVYNDVVPPSTGPTVDGWVAAEREIMLLGDWEFCRGLQNVIVSWISGFSTTETDYIPSATPWQITPSLGSGMGIGGRPTNTSGWAAADRGVAFVGGAALALVQGVPTTGQYAYSQGVYTFAAADAGRQVTISYDYVPADIQQAAIELVALKIKQRANLGVKSRTLVGESVQFEDRSMPPAIKDMLWPFRKLIPV